MTPDRLRIAAALAASLVFHALLLALLRLPPPPPLAPNGSPLNLLLIAIPRASPPAPELSPAPRLPPRASPDAVRPETSRDTAAAAPPATGAPRRRSATVSAAPLTAPRAAPPSRLADAQSYLAPERLTLYPDFVTPFRAAYPRKALEDGRRGVVVVQVMIDEQGRVAEALPVPGPAEDFVETAVAALRAARFRPAEAGGRPVKARAYFAVSFVIE